MIVEKNKDPFLSTKLRIAGNVAGAIYTDYTRYRVRITDPVNLDAVAHVAASLTEKIFAQLTGGSRG